MEGYHFICLSRSSLSKSELSSGTSTLSASSRTVALITALALTNSFTVVASESSEVLIH